MQNVVVKLQGGLGNQMFQYAFSRALSDKLKTDVALDILDYRTASRKFGLGAFNCELKFSDESDRRRLRTPFLKLKRELKKIVGLPYSLSPTHCRVESFRFDSSVFDRPLPCYFEGHFQSEKYFSGISGQIRKEFEFARAAEFSAHSLFSEIVSGESVSVHVRCGDYLRRRRTRRILHVCTRSYYERAIEQARRRLGNPKFYLFSDDIALTLKMYEFMRGFTPVEASGDVHEMFLMSRCRHNIIPNSTFSWWAAWLNPNPEKLVIAPQQWFTPLAGIDYRDVVPESWTKVDTRD